MEKEIEKFLKELDKLTAETFNNLDLKEKRFKLRVIINASNKYIVFFETNITGEWGGFGSVYDTIEEAKADIVKDLEYRRALYLKYKEREDENE